MLRFLIIIFFIPLITKAQVSWQASKELETSIYCQAISEYLNVYKKDKPLVDTLFVGKHEEFPVIQLPTVIANTKIVLITNDEGTKRNKCSKPFILINVVNLEFTKEKAKFIIVNFINFYPQHNCYLDLIYNSATKKYTLTKIRFNDSTYKKNYFSNITGKTERNKAAMISLSF